MNVKARLLPAFLLLLAVSLIMTASSRAAENQVTPAQILTLQEAVRKGERLTSNACATPDASRRKTRTA